MPAAPPSIAFVMSCVAAPLKCFIVIGIKNLNEFSCEGFTKGDVIEADATVVTKRSAINAKVICFIILLSRI